MALQGRVALVTGAGSERGLGNAMARSLAGAGAEVVLSDIDVDGARRNAAAIGASARAVALDVTSEQSVAAALKDVGRVDILVNSRHHSEAGDLGAFAGRVRPDAGHQPAGWVPVPACGRQGHDGKTLGTRDLDLERGGQTGGGIIGTAHYAASKAAVIGLCQAAARELGPYGITSNAIAPGFILTGIATRAVDAQADREMDEKISAEAPLRRSGLPDDIAAAAAFLASEEAAYITGEVMDVNGGIHFD